MNASPFRDYDEMPEWRYDYDFAPVQPNDPEYRQVFADVARRWLEMWTPRAESIH